MYGSLLSVHPLKDASLLHRLLIGVHGHPSSMIFCTNRKLICDIQSLVVTVVVLSCIVSEIRQLIG